MSADTDRIKGALLAFIRSAVPRLAYYGSFPAKVVTQNADGSLELIPDDPTVPPHSNVPIKLGLPGASVKVAAGARVLLGFAGGDPSQPQAELWESGTVTELDLNGTVIKLNGGVLPIARATDTAGPYPIVGGNASVLG